jgi:hypothetical protein
MVNEKGDFKLIDNEVSLASFWVSHCGFDSVLLPTSEKQVVYAGLNDT